MGVKTRLAQSIVAWQRRYKARSIRGRHKEGGSERERERKREKERGIERKR